MRRGLLAALLWLTVWPRTAGADGNPPAVNGYVANRLSAARINPSGLMPSNDVPGWLELAEANVQLRVDLGSPSKFAYADLSLFFQRGWAFYADNGQGGRTEIPHHDVPALRPLAVTSELYLSYSPAPWLNLLAGKKRIVWGSGFAINPADLINVRKDPTDPTFQRSGSWVLRAEAPFRTFTISALFAPEVNRSEDGIPYSFLRRSERDPVTGHAEKTWHHISGVRLYSLIYDADINVMYFLSNRFQNGGDLKSHFAASFSRYFFSTWELHLEGVVSQGSARLFATPTEIARTKRDHGWYPRVVWGTRHEFSDASVLSLEHYFQADGASTSEFRNLLSALSASTDTTSMTTAGPALPQRVSFEPLRRHYLIASWFKPRIHDDWTVGGTILAGVQDASGLASASASWSVCEWLTLSLFGYLPVRGLSSKKVAVGDGRYSEQSLIPYDHQIVFEARAFY